MLKVTDLSFSYGLKPLFEKANFSFGKNMKVALVGPNGAGKSTLFRMITQEEFPDSGNIEVMGSIAMVPQEIKYDKSMLKVSSIRQYLDPNHLAEDFELNDLLRGLEMGNLKLESNPINLSGGQKTKLAIIRSLIAQPNLLLLDEPTNFLDIEGKKWIMNYLSSYSKSLFVISHDLKLLNNVIDKVIAINPDSHQFEQYTGNYDDYLRQKKQKDEQLRRYILNEQKHLKQMKEGLLKMARYTSEKGVRQRTRLKKRIQKLESHLPELPKNIQRIKLSLPLPMHTGEVPIIVNNISKSFGNKKILSNFSFPIKRGENIALIGKNGSGKSTLLKIIIGLLEPDSGSVQKDQTVSIGYYSQEFETFAMEKTLYDTVGELIHYNEKIIRSVLAKFLFPGNKIFQKVGSLSGGEKTRLSIALLLLKNHNLLILDEPTTYLDILSQKIILEALKQYKGTIILVSHTEEFVKELNPVKVLLLPKQKIAYWDDTFLEKIGYI